MNRSGGREGETGCVYGKVALHKSTWMGDIVAAIFGKHGLPLLDLARISEGPHKDSVSVASCQKHSEKQGTGI